VPAALADARVERLEPGGRACDEGIGEAEPPIASTGRAECGGQRRVEGRDADGTALARAPVGRHGEAGLVHVHDVETAVGGKQACSCCRGCRNGDGGAAAEGQRRAERQRQRLAGADVERVRIACRECGEPSAPLAQDRAIGGGRGDDDLVALRGQPPRNGPDVVLDHAGLVRVERGDVRDPHAASYAPAGCGAAAVFAAVRELRRMNSSTSSRALSSACWTGGDFIR
jgi:hypothetical protein